MTQNDTESGDTDQLAVGNILRRGDNLYIIERGPSPAGDVVVGEVGDREIKPDQMFDVGDDCPLPICDGEVVEDKNTSRKRYCSEGCLEWIRNVPADGDECPDYSCDDGVAIVSIERGSYDRECTECTVRAFGSVRWREAWWPYAKQEVLDHLSSDSDEGNDRPQDTGTERAEKGDKEAKDD